MNHNGKMNGARLRSPAHNMMAMGSTSSIKKRAPKMVSDMDSPAEMAAEAKMMPKMAAPQINPLIAALQPKKGK